MGNRVRESMPQMLEVTLWRCEWKVVPNRGSGNSASGHSSEGRRKVPQRADCVMLPRSPSTGDEKTREKLKGQAFDIIVKGSLTEISRVNSFTS